MTYPLEDPVDEFQLPPPKPGRDYEEESDSPPLPLMPMAPREKELVKSFKKAIAFGLSEQMSGNSGKTTQEFLDELALDLWRLTRRS